MANHLIIGLGGTGGSILREMRKRIYEEFNSNTPGGKINIEYLYVDSSLTDLNDQSQWKTMGGSVHLQAAQKISINGIGANVLDNLHQYPGIASFVTPKDRELMKDIGGLISTGIGGQRRRLGRLLFANNVATLNDNNFLQRMSEAVQRLSDGDDEAVVFHVCAGLAGGTGSGSIIDTIAQIRKKYGPLHGVGENFKLLLYLYVPEMIVVNLKHDSGFYRANGYAALDEINAMSVGAYLPTDVSGAVDENGQVKRLLKNINAFETAYLFSNVNEAGRKLKIGSDLPAAVADFLFQKIVSAGVTGGQMDHLNTCENDGGDPECDIMGNPVHSRKFMTFGIKRIEYPENEIKEFVTYSYAKQAARQMKYNLWREGIGYEECSMEEVGMGYATKVKEKKSLEDMWLSDDYLTLQKKLDAKPNDKSWNNINDTWENVTQFFAVDARAEGDKKMWLPAFLQLCEDYYNRDFRSEGVKNFYQTQRKEKRAYAAFIRRHIEELLFNEWLSGEKSALEISKYISAIISNSTARIEEIKARIAYFDDEIKNDIQPTISNINTEWKNISWLKDMITKTSEKLFLHYKDKKRDFYIASTMIEAYQYAIELLQAVLEELTSLQRTSDELNKRLTEMAAEMEKEVVSKCNDDSPSKSDDGKIIRKYDPEQVREITKRFTTNSDKQAENAAAIRNELCAQLGEDGRRSFGVLLERVDQSTINNIAIKTCLSNAEKAMEDIAAGDPSQKMLKVNILEKIKQEYNNDERLEEFITGIVKSSQCYLQFNSEETGKILPGKGATTSMMRMIQLCLPEYDDPTHFRDRFIQMFIHCCPGFKESDVCLNYKSNQIVVVSAASAFPLRYIANTANLKDAYQEKLIGPLAALNKMVMHTESFTKPLPPLFEKSVTQKRKELIPAMLKSFAMGLVVDKEDVSTGISQKAIGFKDILGDIGEWVMLGNNVVEAVDKIAIDDLKAEKIKNEADAKYATYIHVDDKAKLIQSLNTLLKTDVLAACKGNDLDPLYKEYRKEVLSIAESLNKR